MVLRTDPKIFDHTFSDDSKLLLKFAKSHPDWYKRDCATAKLLSIKIRRWERRLERSAEKVKNNPDLYFLAKRRILVMKLVIMRIHHKANIQL